MTDYQITIEGLRGSALLPYVEEISQIAADNCEQTDYDLLNSVLRQKEQFQQKALDLLRKPVDKAPFYAGGARILIRSVNWGTVRPETQDVFTLSERHPENIFYFTMVTGNDGRMEIDSLKNFWRGRIQGGQITAVYEAEPIVWTNKNI